MSECVPVQAERRGGSGESAELILTSVDGTGRVWRRHYHARLALAFDAHELGVLQTLKSTGPAARQPVSVELAALQRFRFVQDEPTPEP